MGTTRVTKNGAIQQYVAFVTYDSRKYVINVEPGKGIVSWEKQLKTEEVPRLVHDSAIARVPAGTIEWVKEHVDIVQGRPVSKGYHLTLRLAEKQLNLKPDGSVDDSLHSLQTIGW